MAYETIASLTIQKIERANGNEVAVKRADGAVFTVRHHDASRYYVRDTRNENSPLSGFSLTLADILDRINSNIAD